MKHFSVWLGTVLIFIFQGTVSGQNLSDLDAQNGFKDFHFGDPKSKWQDVLIKPADNKIVNSYLYTGACCETAFLKNTTSIHLRFDTKNELAEILIQLQNIKTSEIKGLYEVIKLSFGESTFYESESEQFHLEWSGSKVFLGVYGMYKGTEEWEVHFFYVPIENGRPLIYTDH